MQTFLVSVRTAKYCRQTCDFQIDAANHKEAKAYMVAQGCPAKSIIAVTQVTHQPLPFSKLRPNG